MSIYSISIVEDATVAEPLLLAPNCSGCDYRDGRGAHVRIDVAPYLYTYRTKVKPRWAGRSLATTFAAEFERYANNPALLRSFVALGLLRIERRGDVIAACGGGGNPPASTGERPRRGMTKKQLKERLVLRSDLPSSSQVGCGDTERGDDPISPSSSSSCDPQQRGVILFRRHLLAPRRVNRTMEEDGAQRIQSVQTREEEEGVVDEILFRTLLEPSDIILHTLHKHEVPLMLRVQHRPPSSCVCGGPRRRVVVPAILLLRFIPGANVLVVAKPSGLPTLPSGRNIFNALTSLVEHALCEETRVVMDNDALVEESADVRPRLPHNDVIGCSASMPQSEQFGLAALLSSVRRQNIPLQCYFEQMAKSSLGQCAQQAVDSETWWRPPAIRAHPLHRLDTGTSGVIALQLEYRRLGDSNQPSGPSSMWRCAVKDKRYVAHVSGDVRGAACHLLRPASPTDDQRAQRRDSCGSWWRCDLPMCCFGPSRFGVVLGGTAAAPDATDTRRSYRVMEWGAGTGGVKPATSGFYPVDCCGATQHAAGVVTSSFVGCVPVTGRTHQLRVHLSAIGCPIVGDVVYGTPSKASSSTAAVHSIISTELCSECAEIARAPPGQLPQDQLLDAFHLHALSCVVHVTPLRTGEEGASEEREDAVVRITADTVDTGLPAWCSEVVAQYVVNAPASAVWDDVAC